FCRQDNHGNAFHDGAMRGKLNGMSQLTPDDAPNVRQLLAFYLEAGVDCALGEEPINRLADAEPALRQVVVQQSPPPTPPAPTAPVPWRCWAASAGGGNCVGAGSGPHRPDAGGAARADGKVRRLRAEIDGDAARVRRRKSAGPHHVRGRSPRAR